MASARVWLCESPQATEDLACALGARLRAGDVLALDGELGAGKTAFVRGLALGLEVQEPVSSPTYVLMNVYCGRLELYHFDAWMEGREEAFLADGGSEWLRAGGVSAVEWASRVAEWLPLPRLQVRLAHAGPQARRIEIEVLPDARGGEGGLGAVLAELPAPRSAPHG